MVLRHRDKELLRFDWVGDARVRIVAVNDAERRFLPIDFGKERFDCADDALRHPLEDWLVSRSSPVGRHFMRNLMDSLGLNINSPSYHRKALEFSKGLSLNDVYWVVPDDFRGTWAEFNLYDNPFSEAMAEIAFTGRGRFDPRKASTSPEMTTNGMLPKCWVREEDGIYLYNVDRHLGNFGYLVDNDTNEIVDVAPIFDNGYGLMPHLDVSARSAENDYYAIRNYLRDKHPALFRGWMDFPYELTEELLSRLEALEKFRFRKQRHYNWSDERCAVLSGFLQKRADDIRRFGRKAGLKRRGSDKVGEWYF